MMRMNFAAVLYEDGDFELLGLADPTRPIRLARYARHEDYKKWSGIRSVDGRIVIYGEEGLEFVRFTARGPVAEQTWNRGDIGRVLSIAPVGEDVEQPSPVHLVPRDTVGGSLELDLDHARGMIFLIQLLKDRAGEANPNPAQPASRP